MMPLLQLEKLIPSFRRSNRDGNAPFSIVSAGGVRKLGDKVAPIFQRIVENLCLLHGR
jgi:hypothetical protein